MNTKANMRLNLKQNLNRYHGIYYQWPLAGGTPTTLYSIWTYDNDRNLKYLTRVNSNPYDLLPIFGPMIIIVT